MQLTIDAKAGNFSAPPAGKDTPKAAPLPADFVFESEHPLLPIPFVVIWGDARLEGSAVSVTAAHVAIDGKVDPAWIGHKQIVTMQFAFDGFAVTLFPEIAIGASDRDGEMILQFQNPTGAHLPQLRYILNTYIAGDIASLGGMLAYTGPTKPKSMKKDEKPDWKHRIRGFATAGMSAVLIMISAGILLARFTQSYEPRPVFIERAGQDMKATTAGQISYLNPDAPKGDVVFAITANSGDVLNFTMPCDCEVVVTEGIYEGATVLPIDNILSLFDSTVGVRVETLMSVEGLGRVLDGDQAYLDMSDGRTIAADVVLNTASYGASQRGDLFVPVTLATPDGAITVGDMGKTARLRLSRKVLGIPMPAFLETP
jgi:mannuronan synthase